MVRVLFICLGNICRSPLAEGVFRQCARDAGLDGRIEIDSAGTSAWHEGEPPDARTAAEARRRGVELSGRARQLRPADLRRFDYLVVMDEQNRHDVLELAGDAGPGGRLLRLRDFDPDAHGESDVPDPYFGGSHGFARVHDMVDRACRALLDEIRRAHEL